MESQTNGRGRGRTLTGEVVSTGMDKTVVVRVARRFKHPRYQKYMTRSRKYMAHDEENACRVGDEVVIVESRPISKNKCWRVRSILRSQFVAEGAES